MSVPEDHSVAEIVSIVLRLLQQVPLSERPAGLDALAETLSAVREQGHLGEPDLEHLLPELREARAGLAGLLDGIDLDNLTAEEPGDPDALLQQGRALAAAWAQQDGPAVDALLQSLRAQHPDRGAEQRTTRRTARLRASAAASIAASLRRRGIVPSADRDE